MSKRGHRPYPMGKRRTAHWQVCNRCGLVLLKNKASQKAWAADRDKEQLPD